MVMNPPDKDFIVNNLREIKARIANIEKKLVFKEQCLSFHKVPYQYDIVYVNLHNLSFYLKGKYNYWTNFLGEFEEKEFRGIRSG